MSAAPSTDTVLPSFAERIREAAASERALQLRGAGSKDFYGEAPTGEVLDTRAYAGVVDYEPTELVITARCGTPVDELEKLLDEHGQMLGFEPPRFGGDATVGGAVAAGLSGPRRVACGSVRDFVLGIRLLDGQARDLSFGGRVMKNVAGYDVSRLVAGSLGTLALILEVSLKTLPKPVAETTLRLETTEADAIEKANRWAGRLPLSASAWNDGVLSVRLSGATAAVDGVRDVIGGEVVQDASAWWTNVRDQTDPFFQAGPLWRLSVPTTTPAAAFDSLGGKRFIEWNGGVRWLSGSINASAVREAAARHGGHATLFRSAPDDAAREAGVFQPLSPALAKLHRSLKAELDPGGVFDPGRLYRDSWMPMQTSI